MEYNISSGQVSSGIILNNYDSMNVHFSGIAESTTVNGGGNLYVFSGGTASWTAVNQKGYLSVGNGATAQSITENGGYVQVDDNKFVTFTPNTFSGLVFEDASATVNSGTTAVNTTLYSNGRLHVYNGGSAMDTMVNSGAELEIFFSGMVSGVTVNSGGSLFNNMRGSVAGIVENGGFVWVEKPAKDTFIANTFSSLSLSDWQVATVHSGTTAVNTTVNSGGILAIYSGGSAVGITENGGYVQVDDNAIVMFIPNTFSGLILSSWGESATVHSGTTAVSTTVDSNGRLEIHSGGTASNITILSSGAIMLTVASDTYIQGTSGGSAFEMKDAFISGYTVTSNAWLRVISGGTASDVTIDGWGSLEVSSGGTAKHTNVRNNAWMYISQGGLAKDATVGPEGKIYVFRGGVADRTTVSSGGCLDVDGDGSVSNTNIINGRMILAGSAVSTTLSGEDAFMNVNHGASAVSTFIDNDGMLKIYSGGTADGITLGTGAILKVKQGGLAANVVWTPTEGKIDISSGGTITFASDYTGVYLGSDDHLLSHAEVMNGLDIGNMTMAVMPGGTADSCSVGADGCVSVWTGASINGLAVNGGELTVFSGGTAADVIWTPTEGTIYFADGATVTFASSYSGVYYGSNGELLSSAEVMSGKTVQDADMHVFSGGIAVSTVVNEYGEIRIWNGGIASGTTITNDGEMNILSGGVADGTEITGDGDVDVCFGGIANNTIISGYGNLEICDGAVANDTTVESGTLEVDENSIANRTTVNEQGEIRIYRGGTANSVTLNYYAEGRVSGTVNFAEINSGGNLAVEAGRANFVTIHSGGRLSIKNHATVCSLQIESGAIITDEGSKDRGTMLFDLTERKTSDAALVNDLSLVNIPLNYAITVSVSQENGIYKLADGADGFAETVVIRNTKGNQDTITVGGTVKLLQQDYTLTLDSGALTLTVSGEPMPEKGTSGDLNGDGRADIVMTITEVGHGAEGATGAWLIQENQTAAWGDLSQRNPGWEIFGTGKTVAGKNTDDVYIKSSDNVIGAWTTGDDGKVSGWETVGEFDSETQIVGLGDFNANGQTDLLLRNVNGAVGCFFTSGEKTGWNYFQSLGDEWKLTAVGDLNGDGRDDVVLKHDAGFAGSWLTQEDGTMAWADLDTLPEGFAIIGAGDFNGDGTDDVLLKSGNYYGAWLVNNGNAAGWMGIGDLGDVAVEQISDFNSDGKADLRIRTAAGDLGTQLVMGADTLDWKYYGSVGSEWSTALASLA